jgi:hypothetical protein
MRQAALGIPLSARRDQISEHNVAGHRLSDLTEWRDPIGRLGLWVGNRLEQTPRNVKGRARPHEV